jgi:hypothetical protein
VVGGPPVGAVGLVGIVVHLQQLNAVVGRARGQTRPWWPGPAGWGRTAARRGGGSGWWRCSGRRPARPAAAYSQPIELAGSRSVMTSPTVAKPSAKARAKAAPSASTARVSGRVRARVTSRPATQQPKVADHNDQAVADRPRRRRPTRRRAHRRTARGQGRDRRR